jgi:hypothetical protein
MSLSRFVCSEGISKDKRYLERTAPKSSSREREVNNIRRYYLNEVIDMF